MNQKERVLVFDLCQGIAAYVVVLVHSVDQAWGVSVDIDRNR